MNRIPIRGRIALYGGAVVAVTVLLFGVVVYALYQRNLEGQQDGALVGRGQQLWRAVQSGDMRGLPVRGFFVPQDLSNSSQQFFEILDSSGSAVFSSAVLNGQPPAVPSDRLRIATPNHALLDTITPPQGRRLRVWVQGWSRPDLGLTGYVVVGQPMAAIDEQLTGLRVFLVSGALLSLLGALAATWFVAGRALRPLESMARTAEEIGETQDLSRRLHQPQAEDEVGRLQTSFNRMLVQLEDAYHRLQGALAAQRRFVADASHELRTPLTTIRGNIGLLLSRSDITTTDRTAALSDIAGESERMSRMVQDLLTLARADAGYHLEKSPVDVRPILTDVSRQAQTLQPARTIEFPDGAAATVLANADALKQLMWILVDNAVKHTGAGGLIRLGLSSANGSASLTVADDGTGIPEQDLERIFERFYQADPNRTGEGTGLGLAIASWIAREHDGRVYAANNSQGGATFTVEIPAKS